MNISVVIKSFSDALTEKILNGDRLTKKERKKVGALNLLKAMERLILLDLSAEKDLMLHGGSHYHSLLGSNRYSIDADARDSPWRITFQWENEEMINVELVKIEDTH